MENKIIHKGAANHIKGIGSVGGNLFCYEEYILFEPKFTKSIESKKFIDISEICSIVAKGLNKLVITLKSNEIISFRVFCKKEWAYIIDTQRKKQKKELQLINSKEKEVLLDEEFIEIPLSFE